MHIKSALEQGGSKCSMSLLSDFAFFWKRQFSPIGAKRLGASPEPNMRGAYIMKVPIYDGMRITNLI